MSRKSKTIADLIESLQGQGLDAHYLGYFECFNRQLFFEAHDVLEELWLSQRDGPNHGFYKGLIQLAGAFVHLQKGRLGPAAALFRLARRQLNVYPAIHEKMDVAALLVRLERWLSRLETDGINPLAEGERPELKLVG